MSEKDKSQSKEMAELLAENPEAATYIAGVVQGMKLAKVWAHRITPTMQPETWGRRRLPRPFRQSGVLPTED